MTEDEHAERLMSDADAKAITSGEMSMEAWLQQAAAGSDTHGRHRRARPGIADRLTGRLLRRGDR